MPLPPEYVEVLRAVVACLTGDAQTPLLTAEEVTAWLHTVAADEVRRAATSGADGADQSLLAKLVHCILANTHDPRLADWTPEMIADWCGRTHLSDIQAVLGRQVA